MKFWISIGFILLLAAGWMLRTRYPKSSLACLGVAMVGGVVGFVMQYLSVMNPGAGRIPDRLNAAVAFQLGQMILPSARGWTGQMIVQMAEDVPPHQEMLEAQYSTLKRVLLGLSNLDLWDAYLSEKAGRDWESGRISWSEFEADWEGATNGVVAVVSFVGWPAPDSGESRRWKPEWPTWVFDPSRGTNWVADLSAGKLKAVIVPRDGERLFENEIVADSPDQIFKDYFEVILPANALNYNPSISGAE